MRRVALLVAALASLLVLAACGGQTSETSEVVKEVTKVVTQVVEGETVEKVVVVTATPEPSGPEPVTVNINWGTEPPTADPALSTDTTSHAVIEEIFLGLTDLDPETAEAIPELALEWNANEDNTVWTFKMRDNAVWVRHVPGGETEVVTDDEGNPRKVTAHDVVYGVKRTCDPRTGSDYSYILYIIKGCEELNTADPDAENFQELYDAVGVRAVDDFTVEFELNYGAGFFPQIASMPVTFPVPQWVIEEKGDRWVEPGFIVTNGPYVIDEWVHGDHLDLVRNPHWYGWEEFADKAGNIERLHGVMIEEASTEFALYESNELDTAGVPLEQMDRVKTDPVLSKELVNNPVNCTYYYGFITKKAPTDDVRVRRALSMAIDRKTLVEAVLKGGQIPANAFTNPLNYGSPAGDPEVAPWALPEDMGGWGYAKAVEEAKKLLEEAGYPDGSGLDILLMHNVSEGHAKIAQAIQAMWQQAFPQATVTIETQEWRVYLKTIEKDSPLEDKPNVYRLGWCADYPHANNWVHEVFHPEEGSNRPMMSYDDPQVGDLVREFAETTKAAQTASPEEQLALYKRAEQLLVDEIAAMAPIYYYTRVAVAKPWLDRVWGEPGRMYLWMWKLDVDARNAAMGK
ncbi:peptide ABC transporter substrate-binding protein [Ardenticatena maritima]|uniref:Solute-binding protein family 5 domain-containing protein n=1 Tax=Ardenticatena maritima TaxID=872965 RepID=A0A0P6XS85_9CHLR|nr:peptide ABC transporter substrate-binding protein [Ardenticatena maritima]KPL87167.1 hypothetical protein SE16_11560 [Ardenticatena maritima]